MEENNMHTIRLDISNDIFDKEKPIKCYNLKNSKKGKKCQHT
jgi:hypothetical protein